MRPAYLYLHHCGFDFFLSDHLLTKEEAYSRINSQKADEFYEKNCDYIIYNGAEIENLSAKVKEVVEQLATSIEYEDEKK